MEKFAICSAKDPGEGNLYPDLKFPDGTVDLSLEGRTVAIHPRDGATMAMVD